jgi:hypothetical protein
MSIIHPREPWVTEGEGSVQLTSSLRLFSKKENFCFSFKSSWSKLVIKRRSTGLILSLLLGFPGIIHSREPLRKGRLSTVDLRIKIVCFEKKKYIFKSCWSELVNTNQVNCTDPSPSVRIPCAFSMATERLEHKFQGIMTILIMTFLMMAYLITDFTHKSL